jgi:ribosomal protein S18 acetylase RimI-like enzyme
MYYIVVVARNLSCDHSGPKGLLINGEAASSPQSPGVFLETDMRIQPYEPEQRDAVVRLALRAWAPVFDSIQKVMDVDVYQAFYPDWRVSQQLAVEGVCAAEDMQVWVAIDAGVTVGFVAVKLHVASSMGEIYMIAVDPDYQCRGIGTALTAFALERMMDAGMSVAMVETGDDPGHAPARRTYEKAGFGLLPAARYFKKL